jgi:hypothetical protein
MPLAPDTSNRNSDSKACAKEGRSRKTISHISEDSARLRPALLCAKK